jgi:hypoxanthine phosphoribosyltransferase
MMNTLTHDTTGIDRDVEDAMAATLARAKLIFDAATIAAALDTLAAQLEARLRNQYPLMLCVMNGGMIFTGHLLTRMGIDLQIDYLHATRYRNQTRGSDELNWLVAPRISLTDRCVVVLDDILDEGKTLEALIAYCKQQGAREVISAVLLEKHHDRRVPNLSCDFSALAVADHYVFGFGMDYKGRYRHLNAIYAIDA